MAAVGVQEPGGEGVAHSAILVNLPSRGFFASGPVVVTRAPAYVQTAGADPRVRICTEDSTESWLKLWKRTAGSTAPAKKPATAKRAVSTATAGGAGQQGAGTQQKRAKKSEDSPAVGVPPAAPANGNQPAKVAKAQAEVSRTSAGAGPSSLEPSTSEAGVDAPRPGSTRSPFFPPPPPAAAALAAAVNSQTSAKATFTEDQLKKMPVKDLKELCKGRKLQVSGNKEQLVLRIVEYQRRVKRAAQPA